MCNKEIKFKAFLEHALKIGADYIATGHYCQVDHKNGSIDYCGADSNKDQIILCTLNQYQLSKAIFPIGLTKSQVREIVVKHNLVTARRIVQGFVLLEKEILENLSNYLPAKGEIRTLWRG